MSHVALQIYLYVQADVDFQRVKDFLANQQADACLLSPELDDDTLLRTKAACHAADVAVLIQDRLQDVRRLGLDGLHLTDANEIKSARQALGPDAIVGAQARDRHTAMEAGEQGADYLMFVDPSAPQSADADLIAWWMEMMELPCVGTSETPGDFALVPLA